MTATIAARGDGRSASYTHRVFNVTGSELIFLLVAGLMILGPDRLPGVMRKAGRLYGELRRMANSYERDFRDTFKEPITEFRKAAQDVRREIAGFGSVDTQPSPPMRPESAELPPAIEEPHGDANRTDSAPSADESGVAGSTSVRDGDEDADGAGGAHDGTRES